MDPFDELRDAHDVLADFYLTYLDGHLDRSPIERAVLGLFGELTLAAHPDGTVADVGCGTGRLTPYLAGLGLSPRGVDLSPEMVRVAQRENPGVPFEEADLRSLPYADASLAGVVCWYSLIFLPPADRATAFGELARVVRPGGYFVTAFKNGDGEQRRSGRTAGVEFDAYWLSAEEMSQRAASAGFVTVFEGGRPAEGTESTPQGYLLCRRG